MSPASTELKKVKYYVRHSLVSVSVYYSDVWRKLALVLGYTFAVCSFFGFVPQVIYNQWRKSVAGLDLAFLVLEVIDATIYLVYAIGLFYLDAITEQYLDTHETQVIPVAWYDVMFSIQTMAVFMILVVQYAYFRDGDKGMNFSSVLVITVVVWGTIIIFLLRGIDSISWFDVFMYIPWLRLIIAVFKYIPQIATNHSLRSTTGLCMFMVIIEFNVGLAIVGQVIIDVINYQEVTLLLGNFSKFFDGFCTFLGNFIFLIQHLYWYNSNYANDKYLSCRAIAIRQGHLKNEQLPKGGKESTPIQSEKHVEASYGTTYSFKDLF